eukprot:CAMPEP_0172155122 /NCGR_PEP_ID=MMETSP1050-20130122/2442_1 /TAXON_ID=233186 /ORGANISM="Cryptomonas curvata, Strain CCAP979/52" /LENGTH=148 /DNA_ID=CAMNT_0012823969 /DNA_START=224 /DNA_END=667 /DNA_ORIENTATION=+
MTGLLQSVGLYPAGKNDVKNRVIFENENSSLRIEAWGGDNSEAEEQDNEKLLFLWLPGLDGTSKTASPQFADLSRVFKLRLLTIQSHDRSSFDEVVAFCSTFIESWRASSPGGRAQAIVAGESFGGLLSLGIALHRPSLVQGLVLVNP